MMILDTKTKSWVQNKTLAIPQTNRFRTPSLEGATAQISQQQDGTPNFAYFFGGSSVGGSITGSVLILNLQNSTWLDVSILHNEKDNNYVMSRSFVTSVLISNKFFAVAGGDIKQSASSGVSDLDIAQIPKFLTENSFEETGDHQVAVEWVPSISGNSAITTSKGTIFTPAVKFFLVLFMILVFLFLCLYAAIAISKPKVKNGEKGNRFYRFFVLPEVLWHRRYSSILYIPRLLLIRFVIF